MEAVPHARIAERFRANPEQGRVRITVATDLGEGMRCETTVRSHTAVADEPRSFGGTDSAQSPVELLLTSLATCQAITYRIWAAEMAIELRRVHVEVEGHIDLRALVGVADVAPGYEGLRVTVVLEGPEPEERYRALADEVDRHCPVLDALARPLAVHRSVNFGGSR